MKISKSRLICTELKKFKVFEMSLLFQTYFWWVVIAIKSTGDSSIVKDDRGEITINFIVFLSIAIQVICD